MKTSFVLLITGLFICSAQVTHPDKINDPGKIVQENLIGRIKRSDLLAEPYSSWFNEGYASYPVDKATMDSIPVIAWENLEISIILATWCPDTRRELPRLFKIMDYAGFPDQKLDLISVNREKTVPSMNLEHLDIQMVPTIIFFRENMELGRIIETPEESLEKDIAKILTN